MPNVRMLLTALLLVTLFACTSEQPSTLESLIPIPAKMTAGTGSFSVNEKTTIYVQSNDSELNRLAGELAAMLNKATGLSIAVGESVNAASNAAIWLQLAADSMANPESYQLEVSPDKVSLTAPSHRGIFYGIQTLRQLMPHTIETAKASGKDLTIPSVSIQDAPEYSYRGSMLDVSRHFFGVEDIKHYIDLISFYKMNTLHLHLTDDQGWRIEIKSWPQLTAVGGSTQVGGGKGGFYTQDQYREIIQYAAEHYVNIIPEVDMPGHTNAALASYAELNCNDTATQLYTGTEVGFSSLCIKKEVTYRFLDSVIRELAALTPGPYLHIGGDESHATKMEDYIPFMEKVQLLVKKYGKTPIGWDEIANAKIEPGTLAQYWASPENSKMAKSKGAKLIMSPASKAYLDMQYDSTTKLGLHWAGYLEVDTSYLWDPTTLEAGISREDVAGVEAPLWTETITNRKDLEYMIFPRLAGIAEIGWSPAALRNWESYKVRLGNHALRFDAMDINYYRSSKVKWAESH